MYVIYKNGKFIKKHSFYTVTKKEAEETNLQLNKIFNTKRKVNTPITLYNFRKIYFKSLLPNTNNSKNIGSQSLLKKRKQILSLKGEAIPKINLKFNPKAGTPSKFSSLFKHDQVLMNKEKVYINEQIYDYANKYKKSNNFFYDDGFTEILTKKLIYRELNSGDLVPYPKPSSNKVEFYEVKENIITGKGMTASLLMPTDKNSKLPPRLVFCGSKFHPSGLDSISNVIADFEYELGKEAYESGLNKLNNIMHKYNIKNESLVVSGHSLGGNLAQQFTVDNHKKIKKLITFNSPGIKQKKDKEFTNSISRTKRHKPLEVKIIRNYKDIVHHVEDQHLCLNALEKNKDNNIKVSLHTFKNYGGFYRPHTYCNITNPLNINSKWVTAVSKNYFIKKLNNKGKIAEILRSKVASVGSKILTHFRYIKRKILGSRVDKYLSTNKQNLKRKKRRW